MHLIQIIQGYLTDRIAQLTYRTSQAETRLTLSTPQGAVLPFFWNLFIDDLLILLQSKGIKCQAFADDFTVFVEYE